MENMLIGKKLFDQTIAYLEKSLDVRTSGHKVLSGNAANAETHDYKTQDLPFQKILEQAAGTPSVLPLQRTHPVHFPEAGEMALTQQPEPATRIPGGPAGRGPISDFKKVLTDYLESTGKLLKSADQSTEEMIRGKQDIHQTMIALEKANLSLRLMIQVRNKIISAYDEIMRMQM